MSKDRDARPAGVTHCRRCGTALTARQRSCRSQHCSHECAGRRAPREVQSHECGWCGQRFRPKGNDRTSFCSRDCGFEDQRWRKRLQRLDAQGSRARYCHVCFREIRDRVASAITCSPECAAARLKMRAWEGYQDRYRQEYVERRQEILSARPATACAECGEAFVPAYLGMKYCSARCAKVVDKRTRRARIRQADRQAVGKQHIFERDGWRCGICQEPVARRAKVPHPRAPTLDHIIPLSMGGTHTWDNLQCAHFICNSTKGAGAAGSQLRMELGRVGGM